MARKNGPGRPTTYTPPTRGIMQDQPTNVPVEGNRVKSAEEGRGKLDKTFTSSTYGGPVVKKGYTGKKALPLDKSKKKGSPRSYEDASRKPLGKGRRKGVG